MALTKSNIDAWKNNGIITLTMNSEEILEKYPTLEDLKNNYVVESTLSDDDLMNLA